jgi:hypothetical protein
MREKKFEYLIPPSNPDSVSISALKKNVRSMIINKTWLTNDWRLMLFPRSDIVRFYPVFRKCYDAYAFHLIYVNFSIKYVLRTSVVR